MRIIKGIPYNGKIWQVLYLANEPFERNWRILIWRLRRGYYSTGVASTGKLYDLAINGKIRQIAKLKLPPNFPVYGNTIISIRIKDTLRAATVSASLEVKTLTWAVIE